MTRPEMRRRLLAGLGPLALLAVFVVLFLAYGPLGVFEAAFPPVEKLTIERVTLRPGEMVVAVTNGGPQPVTVAQVLVDDAYWRHTIVPDRTVPRLGRATITIPYPWVEGEAHAITLLTSTGLTIEHEVPVAVESPRPDARYLLTFTMLGVYVGVIPVFVGLLWFPFLRQIGRRWLNFFLSLTGGLLVFLGVDTLAEALDVRTGVPGAFQGTGLVTMGVVGTILALTVLVRRTTARAADGPQARFVLAFLIALGIGLHNLGEGLAIGAAYSLGEVALGTFLVLGFLLHNTTEGLGIAAPLARDRPPVSRFVLLGAVAGVPTILGAWLGGFVYSPVFATLFLAIGAGAIFQVVYELVRMMVRQAGDDLMTTVNFAGFAAGLLIMYLTGLFVAG
ncbi:MAG: metal transporter [Armatimonadota bacterium]|nr:metal transporter [Armatimonadota bacterium]MDR7519095.1 metal transporter [Armatimonadota bacterium]